MILFYAPRITNRIKYTASLLLESLCGFQVAYTDKSAEYSNFDGPRINYSQIPLSTEEIFVYSHGLLSMKGIKDIQPEVSKDNSLPVFFSGMSDHCFFGFDIFAAAFYLVSRYEEYLPYKADIHGRFEAKQSLAYKNDFLEKPLVNIYAEILSEAIKKKFKTAPSKENNYVFIPTYDIDNAYAYLGKGVLRNTGGLIKDLFSLKFSFFKERISVLSGRKNDPFDTYNFQFELQKKYDLDTNYFFLAADYGPYDNNIYVYSRRFDDLVKKVGDYAKVGVHASYNSFGNYNRLKMEIKRLSKIANRPVKKNRMHFLRLKLPDVYRDLIDCNIRKDYTMGYAGHIGFRASICSPFYFYDIEREQITNLKVFPFAVMDTTLKNYMKLGPDNAIKKINKLIDSVKKVDGTFISLWHNDSLSEQYGWKGWKKVYEHLVHKASTK